MKVLEGAFRKDRDGAAPAVVGGFPDPPEDLSEAEAALWETFPKPPWIGETDAIVVHAAVATYTRVLALQPLAREGDQKAVDQESKLWGRLMGILAVLGLTPADRSKMQIPVSNSEDEEKWAALLG
jgi:hypothetical protein